MRCSKVRKNVFFYLEDKLKEEDRKKIDEHLKKCIWCREEYAKTKKMFDSLRATHIKMVEEDMHKNIMMEINGLKSFNEEEKKNILVNFKGTFIKSSIAFASLFVAFFVMQFVDVDYFKENGASSLIKLGSHTKDMILEERLENTREENLAFIVDKETSNYLLTRNARQKKEDEQSQMQDETEDNVENSEALGVDTKNTPAVINAKNAEVKIDTETLMQVAFPHYVEDDAVYAKKVKLHIATSEYDKTVTNVDKLTDTNKVTIAYENEMINDSNTDYMIKSYVIKGNKAVYNNLVDSLKSFGEVRSFIATEEDEDEEIEAINNKKNELDDEERELQMQLESAIEETKSEIEVELQEVRREKEKVEEKISNIQDEKNEDKKIKIEVVIEECSVLDMKGSLGAEKLFGTMGKVFVEGFDKFVRFIEVCFLWTAENFIFITFFVIISIIVYIILKNIFCRD